ncbi:MAG TPA: hypothetical protein VFZ65_15400 [Planctomycetota bacterium]|nr:hypothetical protein [Planctomycetota bacterium]
MVQRSTLPLSLLSAVGLLAAACGGSNVSNASPRISEVPLQSTAGGTMFSLDVGAYVADREGATLTYAVAAGGGSFTGSNYSNMFETMGEYIVEFTVSDGDKTAAGSFGVRVTSGKFAVVREDASGLLLLDSATNAFVRVTGASVTPSFAAGLSDGRLVYQLAGPAGQQLWIFDPLKRLATRIAESATGDVVYRAKTSDNKIAYTAGTSGNATLFFYNPVSGLSREIAQGTLSTLTVAVNVDDLVFYEVGSGGPADVRYYDPAVDESFAVGSAPTDEQILAVLPNGACVFSRIGGGGETDLFSYRVATGLVEIGSDMAALDTRNKVYHAFGTASQVVFSAQNGADNELFAWNLATGQTTAIATGNYDIFAAIGSGNEVVYQRVVSGTEVDAFFYDLDSGTTATVRDGADLSVVRGVTSDGTTSWAFVQPSGTPSSMLAVSLVGTPATQTFAAGAEITSTLGVLANGDVVAGRVDGTALSVFDVSAGTWAAPIVGTGLAFAGPGIDDGDFVYTLTASSQTDLSMWDASASTSVVVSDTAGDDTFAARTLDGTILFTRVVTGNTNTDLVVWNGTAATRLTDVDSAGLTHDHTVLGTYSGSR